MGNQASLPVQLSSGSGLSLSVIPLTTVLVDGTPVVSSYLAPSYSTITQSDSDTAATSDVGNPQVVTVVQSPPSTLGTTPEPASNPETTTSDFSKSSDNTSRPESRESTTETGSLSIDGHLSPEVSTTHTEYTTSVILAPTSSPIATSSTVSPSIYTLTLSASYVRPEIANNSSTTSPQTFSPSLYTASSANSVIFSSTSPSASSSGSITPPISSTQSSFMSPHLAPVSTTTFLTTDTSGHTFVFELVVTDIIATVLKTVTGASPVTFEQSRTYTTTPVERLVPLASVIVYSAQNSEPSRSPS